MTTVTIEEAQANLPELIDHLAPGEEVVVTRGEKPVARLLAEAAAQTKRANRGARRACLQSWLRTMSIWRISVGIAIEVYVVDRGEKEARP